MHFQKKNYYLNLVGIVILTVIILCISINAEAVEQLVPVGSIVYDGGDEDYAQAVAVDSEGNIYVTGYSSNGASNFNYFTIKYNPDLSAVLSSITFNGGEIEGEYAKGIAVDNSDNIYVVGDGGGPLNWDCFIINICFNNTCLSVV